MEVSHREAQHAAVPEDARLEGLRAIMAALQSGNPIEKKMVYGWATMDPSNNDDPFIVWLKEHPRATEEEALSELRRMGIEQQARKAEVEFLPFLELARQIGEYESEFYEASLRMSKLSEDKALEVVRSLGDKFSALTSLLTELNEQLSHKMREGLQTVTKINTESSSLNEQMFGMLAHDVKNLLSPAITYTSMIKEAIQDNFLNASDLELIPDIVESITGVRSAVMDDLVYLLEYPSSDMRTPRAIVDEKLNSFLAEKPSRSSVRTSLLLIEKRTTVHGERGDMSDKAAKVPHVTFENTISNADGVYTSADTAVLNNLVLNLLSNACSRNVYKDEKIVKYGIDANEVNVSISRDSTHLIVHVADTGVGLKPEQADPTTEKFIFRTGVSDRRAGTRSTGLGIKDPAYYAEKGITVNVVSRERDKGDIPFVHYSNHSESEADHMFALEQEAHSKGLSTVFEVRVPIEALN